MVIMRLMCIIEVKPIQNAIAKNRWKPLTVVGLENLE
jgi:hypothetical protein